MAAVTWQKAGRTLWTALSLSAVATNSAEPLLAPNQDIYLRENIRSRLLVAAQAVPRHQEETYKQALDNVSTWVRAYYDTDDAATNAFLEDIDKLSQQTITMNVPDQLESQPMLEKLMQTRVRNLLAQSPAAHRRRVKPCYACYFCSCC